MNQLLRRGAAGRRRPLAAHRRACATPAALSAPSRAASSSAASATHSTKARTSGRSNASGSVTAYAKRAGQGLCSTCTSLPASISRAHAPAAPAPSPAPPRPRGSAGSHHRRTNPPRARIDRHVMRRQPQRPVRAVGIMQQGRSRHSPGVFALAPSQQCRTRHRHQHRRHQPHRMQTGITPEPVPQRHVHAVAAQVHHRRRGLDPQLDTRVSRAKTRQPGTSHDAANDAIVLTVTVCRDGARASMSTAASICENACRSSGCAARRQPSAASPGARA